VYLNDPKTALNCQMNVYHRTIKATKISRASSKIILFIAIDSSDLA